MHADELGDTFSDDMVERIAKRLGDPDRCPHGWPVDPDVEQAENRELVAARRPRGRHARDDRPPRRARRRPPALVLRPGPRARPRARGPRRPAVRGQMTVSLDGDERAVGRRPPPGSSSARRRRRARAGGAPRRGHRVQLAAGCAEQRFVGPFEVVVLAMGRRVRGGGDPTRRARRRRGARVARAARPGRRGTGRAPRRPQRVRLVRPLPGEVVVVAAEVAVRRRLRVDRPRRSRSRRIAAGRRSKCSRTSSSMRATVVDRLGAEAVDLDRDGCATPIAYATCSSQRSASPAATTFFAT